MDNLILSALQTLDVASLSRADWLAVGMALQEEGYPCSVWDDWSRNDARYHFGECDRLWKGFHGADRPVRGGTIVKMAKDRGWTPCQDESGVMDWDDAIEYDGADGFTGFPQNGWSPTGDLITYLTTLFDPGDHVAYVTGDVWQNQDGKWVPGRGVCDRTAGDLIASLRKYPDDLGATIGDWKPEAGAWIRFNPVDGEGVKNENITRFRYALVESDSMSIPEQDAALRKLQLPIAVLVHSGGKSLHAIVRVDADNSDEYRKRVDILYAFLEKSGFAVDRQNRNPSRLSRLPGATRNGNRQYLVATNIGRKNWADWMDYIESASDDFPPVIDPVNYVENPPELPEELISGILRRGHKLLISGSSKAGKSFLLMELCIAIAEGVSWLGFPCRKGKVLYVNLEIDQASAINRILRIYEALNLTPHAGNIAMWNLRGHAVPLDQLVPKLIRRVRDQHYDAIIVDPIYKVITGDENSASEMSAFCNQFDRICTETGCSVIFCHHHSKGFQGGKRAMDRASGSGVFARDPDAQLDLIQLEVSDDVRNNVRDGEVTAWRLESSLREFPNILPVNFWFEYPIHRLDSSGVLSEMHAQGTRKAGRRRNPGAKAADTAATEFRNAYQALSLNGPVTVQDMAGYLGVIDKTIYARIRKMGGEFVLWRGRIYRSEELETAR